MHKATMFEAKTNLSKLVQRALAGEDVQITTGRERKPVVRLVPVEPVRKNRRLGFMKGKIEIGPEFFEPLPEDELRLWNGEGE
jgi:antitoxin (DNA-binding transcriptional repressor) of toxin-antitoxin stability system